MKLIMRVSAAAIFLGLAAASSAAPIVWQDGSDGLTGGTFANWPASPLGSGATLDVGGGAGTSVGGNNAAGRIDFTHPGGPGPYIDPVFTTAAGWTGNYPALGYRSLSMDFYSDASRGDVLKLYMVANGTTWYYDVPALSAGWQTIQANLRHIEDITYIYASWYDPVNFYDSSRFQSDLASVTAIGFELTYPAGSGQIYGFDDFHLNDNYFVPEPQTYVILGFALLSLGVVFRRQFHTLVGAKVPANR